MDWILLPFKDRWLEAQTSVNEKRIKERETSVNENRIKKRANLNFPGNFASEMSWILLSARSKTLPNNQHTELLTRNFTKRKQELRGNACTRMYPPPHMTHRSQICTQMLTRDTFSKVSLVAPYCSICTRALTFQLSALYYTLC
jgi:hypothetical protein